MPLSYYYKKNPMNSGFTKFEMSQLACFNYYKLREKRKLIEKLNVFKGRRQNCQRQQIFVQTRLKVFN